jgi:drug/metabolite transporter (DMT)-like permease
MAFAAGNILTRIVSVGGDPLAGSIIRTVPVILPSVFMMALRRGAIKGLLPQRENFIGWRAIGLLSFSSLVVVPSGILALYLAFRYAGVLVAVPIFSVNPLWGALIAVPFLGEAFNKRIGGGIIVTIIGISLLTYGQYVGTPVSPQWAMGVVYASITALTWALTANFRRYFLLRGLDIFWMIGINSSVGVGVLVLLLAALGRMETFLEFSPTQLWQLIIAGGLSALGNFTLAAAAALTTVASMTTLKSLDVVIGSIVAISFLGEVMNLPVGTGILLLVGGIIMVQAGKGQPVPVVK